MPSTPKKSKAREERILMDIIVDAYGPEEQAMGWYCYLEDKLQFPFLARCIADRAISPLHTGDEVEVVGMAPSEECLREMFVTIRWEKRGLAIPLSQIKSIRVDAETRQAIQD